VIPHLRDAEEVMERIVSFRQRCVVEVEAERRRVYFGFLLAGLTLRNSLSHL
jgi:hypothetical protein